MKKNPPYKEKRKALASLLFHCIITGDHMTKKDMLEKAGYSTKTATHSSKEVIQSVQDGELKEYGFTKDNAKRIVASILNGKKATNAERLKAAEQVFKVTGAYAPLKTLNYNMNASPEQKEKASRAIGSLLGEKSEEDNKSDKESRGKKKDK